ncbi:putative disease resistance protein RGA4 [Ananas comosus]|uniref:Putative disease resistance protein RGA4 n=1 Tax=Ananas comosus TaxID=4615 RepID=A0A199ULV5_ANACO|nr:putative disease resistance protein RGA4 [Ananas comosus]
MEEELQRLQQALPQIKAILAFVEVEQQMAERNEALEAWMWQFRDAVEEAEDVLDELEYYEIEKRVQAPDDQVRGTISKLKRKISSFVSPSFRNDTLKRLSEAVKGLDRVAAGMGPFLQLVDRLSGYGVNRRQLDEIRNSRETSSLLLEKEVLGRKTESDMIIEWLIKPTSDEPESLATANISVFSIVGIGGMGKTTLAQLIYHNERVKQYFDQTMWVCVSDIFDAVMLTSKILQDMTKDSPNARNLNTLQEMLIEKLISKRFLLVLDDVWNDDNRMEWEKLVAPLKFGRRGSKILLTTRMDSPQSDFNKNLPEWFSQSVCRLYHLQVLDIGFPSETIENIEKNSITEINGLSDLVNLRLLNVPHGLMTKIRWIGKLTSLRKLRNFHIRVESGYKIGELKDLAELSAINVGNLENVSSSEEAVESKLNEKENLSSLSLNWSLERSSAPEVDEQLLDNLRPHINLGNLSIEGYIGVRYPCWMTDFCLSNLTSICLSCCSRLELLPPLGQLPFLRILDLFDMAAIKRVDWSVHGSADGCAFPYLEQMICCDMPAWEEWLIAADGCPFPQLKILNISDCPNLRGMPTLPLSLRELTIHNVGITAIPAMYRDISNDNNSASSFELAPALCIENSPSLPSIDGFRLQQQEYFQALRILSIEECERLVHLPPEWSANLFSLERLTIIKCPKLITCGIQDSNLPSAIQSLSFGSCGGLYASLLGRLPYLTSLTSLTLHECAITTSLPGAEVFARLASLSRLWIWYCRELASFGGIEALASLEYLSVRGCDKLIAVSLLQPPLGADVSQGGAVASSLRLDHLDIDQQSLLSMEPLRNLSSTRILTLDGSSQLTSLPEQWLLQNRSSLQCLIIRNADSLQSLPPSMTSLYSLQKLTLFEAPSIQSLPEFPASLCSLKIGRCHPVLEERCQKDTGLDWPKIANIPHVTITKEYGISDFC